MKKYIRRFKNWMDFNPPGALSSKGWRLFKREFKQEAPIRFWVTHTLRRNTVLPIKWKWEAISDWIRYRTYDKYHVVKTGLKPQYYDKDTLMLHMNFNLLKEFVEEELSWRSWCFEDEKKEPLTFVQKWVPLGRRFFPYNNPERGIKYLEWEATLDDPSLPPHEQSPHQAVMAREKLALYDWWINGRPGRVEIELPAHPKRKSNDTDEELDIFDDDYDRTSPEYAEYLEILDKRSEQEEQRSIEDTEMLLRLVKVRGSMWT
jgi:hypothetical protein